MIYPGNFELKVGFDVVRKVLEEHCMSPLGVAHCRMMAFSADYDLIKRRLGEVDEFLTIIVSCVEFPLNDFLDVTPALSSIRVPGAYMPAEELFRLRKSLCTIGAIVSFFTRSEAEGVEQYPYLRELCAGMQSFNPVMKEIDRIIDKFGNIKDNASPELLSIKRAIQSATASVNSILRRIISEGKMSGILEADVSPSVRDGRLVIPVAPMNKRKIQGIVHDESATGKTVYIEPGEIVEANNTIRELEGDMRREIIRILTEMADVIRPHIDDMLVSYDILGQIDFIRSKALFAQDLNCSMPHLEQEPQIEWYNAVHPSLFLSLREHGKTVVPLDIKLDGKDRILLISGPNAGGKSVCLKTVGIVQYMVQCGMLPPVYSNSHIGIFRNIFIDIGDEQSIENDLSTYSSHITNMKQFLLKSDNSTIILIDEFGGGTEPQIGGAIAQALLHQLNEKKVFGVITTHYQNLKTYAENSDGIVNGAMLYDRGKMQPLFKLSIGYPGSSFAIEIARKIGLPGNVIEEAVEIVGSDYVNMDKYLLDIARDRRYWEHKRQEIHAKQKKIDEIIEKYNSQAESLNKERREIIHAARQEAKELLAKSNSTIERTIHGIKRVQAEKEQTKELRKQLDEFKLRLQNDNLGNNDAVQTIKVNKRHKKSKENEIKVGTEEIKFNVNDYVVMEGNSTVGQILSVDGKWAVVAFGMLKTKVELKKLRKSQAKTAVKQEKSFVSKATSDDIRKRQLNFKQEIDVRGMRADEAIQAVTYFMDDAMQFNVRQVRILHGTGTGVLKVRIREYLNALSGVKSYRDEHVQFGGAGITVVELE
ncbi:MAG: Smr/MutS family protein [Muribaculaceae bacterium]|nr:Smr/MutS family protein [Muribaculaceae bacterium]